MAITIHGHHYISIVQCVCEPFARCKAVANAVEIKKVRLAVAFIGHHSFRVTRADLEHVYRHAHEHASGMGLACSILVVVTC